ncbi:GNAT family N-acetyltransferase [Paraburkholderia sp. B3]|uniref:GNAT family N-acetyltransferase n=1 Tax=Paraburkholderia sp. B3 TaxID=3134791 RepID=UPI003982584D
MHDPTLSSVTAPAGSIRVRACGLADLEAVAALMNLPRVRHGTLSNGWRTAESLRAWYDDHTPGSVRLCAEIDACVVGNVTLMVGTLRRAHCGSLGIAVDDAFQGRGVGSALMAAIVDYADRSLGLRRIELEVYPDNASAIALYRKFGFVEEGRSRGSSVRDGVLADTLHMARYADAPPFAEPSSS